MNNTDLSIFTLMFLFQHWSVPHTLANVLIRDDNLQNIDKVGVHNLH